MCTLVSKDNSKWRFIFNEIVLLLDKSSKLIFEINDQKLKLGLIVNSIFSDEGEKYTAKSSILGDDKIIDEVLRKWETELTFSHIENTEPLKVTSRSEKMIWLK